MCNKKAEICVVCDRGQSNLVSLLKEKLQECNVSEVNEARNDFFNELKLFDKSVELIKNLFAAKKNSPYQYKFRTASCGLISLAEIAQDVDRKCPVLEVVLEGKNFDQCHYLLVHESITLKAQLIVAALEKKKASKTTKDFLTGISQLRASLKKCTDLVSYIDVSSTGEVSSGLTLRKALKIIDSIREFSLHTLGFEKCNVVVRSR